MECKFVVGQKVLCVADDWFPDRPEFPWPIAVPVKDRIYQIRRIEPFAGTAMLHLHEFRGHRWHHTGFRPLQDRPTEADTDISVFMPALNLKKLEPV